MSAPKRPRRHLAPGGSRRQEEGPTPEALQRRAEAVSCLGLVGVLPGSGGAIAALQAQGYITEAQAATGHQLGDHWRRWRAAYGVPRSSPRAANLTGEMGGGVEIADEMQRALAETDGAIRTAVRGLPRSAFPLLIAVCAGDDYLMGRSAAPLLGCALDAAGKVMLNRTQREKSH